MAQSESPLSDSLSDPSLSQNVSFKRLNDQAAEFVPSPTLIAPASAPAAPLAAVGQVHVYPPPWPSGPFHVPIQAELKEYVFTLDNSNFDDTNSKHDFIVVEFYAPWCGHCNKLTPGFEKVASILSKNDPPIKGLASDYEVREFFKRGLCL
ncbi:hypothetical protein PS2_022494 [Malus domestica]